MYNLINNIIKFCDSVFNVFLLKINSYYFFVRYYYRMFFVNFNKFFINMLNLESSKNLNGLIIKQNKALTPLEFVSSIISSGNNKSRFYSPINSFLPFVISGAVFIFLLVLTGLFFREEKLDQKNWFFFACILFLFLSIFMWFSMFWTEKKLGKHLDIIKHNVVFGFYLFILTEGLCFLALFWTFLHSTLAASIHVGIFNPGEGVVNFYISEVFYLRKHWNIHSTNTVGTTSNYSLYSDVFLSEKDLYSYDIEKVHVNLHDSGSLINPWGLPFINTLILLSSAASLNASHCFTLLSKYFSSLIWLFITLFFGILFIFMQFKEYKNCVLNYNDGIYASCFFGLTGLHGIHVMLGIFALSICFFNLLLNNYSPNFHQSFYFSIFYWHFVDIIWILVWLIIYLWPASYFFTDFYLTCCEPRFFVHNMSVFYFFNCVDYNIWFNFFEIDKEFYNINKKDSNLNIADILFSKKNVSLHWIFLKMYAAQEALYWDSSSTKTKKISWFNFFEIDRKYYKAMFNPNFSYDIDSIQKHHYNYIRKNLSNFFTNREMAVYGNSGFFKSEFYWKKLDYLINIENFYCVYNLNKYYFNFNVLKSNIQLLNAFLNEMHYELYLNSFCPILDDINNKFFRFLFFTFMHVSEHIFACNKVTMYIFNIIKFIHLNYIFSPWYFFV